MEYKYQLIMIICNNGHAGDIVEVTRKEGASGATIVHGKGTYSKEVTTFFGITISPEKEIILIVTTKDKKDQILLAVANDFGTQTDARAICFTFPVEDVVGAGF